MTTAPMSCADAETALGVLVLGALRPPERDEVEQHVQGCARCSRTLAELAHLPGLLAQADVGDGELPAPPASVLDRALAQVSTAPAPTEIDTPPSAGGSAPVVPLHHPRRWLVLAAGAAAAAVVVALAVVVLRPVPPSTPVASPTVASASSSTSNVAASVAMTPVPDGTQLVLTLTGVRPGEQCELVAVGHQGTREVAASWTATYRGKADVTGTTGLKVADIARFDITTPDGRTLLQVPVTT